jgi:hypothetical protein
MSTSDDPFAAPEPGGSASGHGQAPQGHGYGQTPQGYGQAPQGQGYGPAPYGAPPPGYGYPPYPPPPPARTNGFAIASMVLGIVWIYWIGSVLALVFGYVAKRQIRERGEQGGGMATAGIVLGWIGVGFFALFVLLGIAGAFAGS